MTAKEEMDSPYPLDGFGPLTEHFWTFEANYENVVRDYRVKSACVLPTTTETPTTQAPNWDMCKNQMTITSEVLFCFCFFLGSDFRQILFFLGLWII